MAHYRDLPKRDKTCRRSRGSKKIKCTELNDTSWVKRGGSGFGLLLIRPSLLGSTSLVEYYVNFDSRLYYSFLFLCFGNILISEGYVFSINGI